MSKDDNDDEYKVGYKRPPKHTQFKKGKSGCPGGRKPEPSDIDGYTEKHLQKKARATIGGKSKLLKKEEIIAMQRVDRAARGDRHATDKIYEFRRGRGRPTVVVTPEDKSVFQAALGRLAEEQRIQEGWKCAVPGKGGADDDA